MQAAVRQRARSPRGGGKVWVTAYTERNGTRVAGHWRSEPGNGTVLKDDMQQHVQGLLSAHASAIQRADQIRAQLQAYAQTLAGRT